MALVTLPRPDDVGYSKQRVSSVCLFSKGRWKGKLKKSENINITLELAASNNSSELGLARGGPSLVPDTEEALWWRNSEKGNPWRYSSHNLCCDNTGCHSSNMVFISFLNTTLRFSLQHSAEHLLILVRAGPLCKCVKYVGRGRERFLKKEVLTISWRGSRWRGRPCRVWRRPEYR